MKRVVLSVVAVVAAIAVATGVLKSHALLHFGSRGMPPIQELQTREQLDKLPVQEFEDRSLVFPRETSR
jgi:hypothetical protein